jgi:hypothetical protein
MTTLWDPQRERTNRCRLIPPLLAAHKELDPQAQAQYDLQQELPMVTHRWLLLQVPVLTRPAFALYAPARA